MSTSARAPNVHQVFTPLISQPPSVGGGGDLDAGDVGAEVGLGDRHRVHAPRPWPAWAASRCFCSSVPPLTQRPGEDLGPGDERAADAERAAGQLLGGDDHADVVGLAAGGEAAVLLGDRQAEGAHLGQARDDVLGDVVVVCGGCARRPGLSLSSAKRRNVSCTSSKSSSRWRGPSSPASDGEERRGRGRRPRTSRAPSSAPGSTPHSASRPKSLAARSATASATKAQVMRGLDVALGAVVEQRPGGLDRRRRRGRGRRRAPGASSRPPAAARRGDAGVDDGAGRRRRRRRRRRGRASATACRRR